MTNSKEILLRSATPDDSEFAYKVKEEAFRDYVEQVRTWVEEDQRQQHDRRFSEQNFQIVERGSERVGVIATVVHDSHLQLNQLMIHPDHQAAGIGEHCLQLVLDRAQGLGLPVRLQWALVHGSRFGFIVWLPVLNREPKIDAASEAPSI